MMIRNIFYL